MSWQLLLGIAVLTEVVGRLLQRVLLKDHKSDPVAYAIVYQFLIAGILAVFAIIKGFVLPTDWSIWPHLIAMPFLWLTSNYLIFSSLKHTEASTFTILFSSRTLWVILASLIFLGESLSGQQILGTILIAAAVLIVSWNKSALHIKKGEKLALLGALVFGIAVINDIYIIRSFDIFSYFPFAFFLPGVLMWIVFPKARAKTPVLLRGSVAVKITALAIVYGIDTLAYYLAYQAGNNSAQIASIFQVSTILTVLAAIIILGEKERVWVKILAGAISFIGVLLVS